MSNQRKAELITALQEEICEALMRFARSMINSLVQHDPDGNMIFSPVSVYATLALIYFGATGDTRKEIAEIMGLPPKIESRALLELLNEMLLSINIVMETIGRRTRSIDIQNRLFVQSDTNLIPSYVSHIRSISGCDILNVDFENEPENATDIINDCVSRNTNGGISRCLAEIPKYSTHMIFTSCINLHLTWIKGFRHRSTRSAKFFTSRGDVDVQMIRYQTCEKLSYIDLPNLHLEALEIPFEEEHESMYIILPKLGTSLDEMMSSLDYKTLREIINQVVPANVDVNLPCMNLACIGNLYEALRTLGTKDAFDDRAELNNMTTDHSLRVSKIIHAVNVEFGEEKAGVMTKITHFFGSCSRLCGDHIAPSFGRGTVQSYYSSNVGLVDTNPIGFDVNRPFLFFIHHRISKSILFLGVIRNPAVE